MDILTSFIYFTNDGILAGKSPRTLKGYKSTLDILLEFLNKRFCSPELSSINKELLEQFFIEGLKIRRWNKYTHWTYYKNLNVFLNWCVKKGNLSDNPLAEISKPRQPQLPPKSLNEKEALALLHSVSTLKSKYYFTHIRNKAVIACLIFTGLRKSELTHLRYQDVDLENGFISVEFGKGGKKREIPIEESGLKPILMDYVDYRNRLYKTSEWFFNGTFSNRGSNDNQLAISTVDRLFTKLSKLNGKRVGAHKLRHTFATLLLDKTGDIYTLKELMGHSNIATTCIYLSSTRRKKVEAISHLKL